MGVEEIRAYLSHLAVDKNVAASTQNVARKKQKRSLFIIF